MPGYAVFLSMWALVPSGIALMPSVCHRLLTRSWRPVNPYCILSGREESSINTMGKAFSCSPCISIFKRFRHHFTHYSIKEHMWSGSTTHGMGRPACDHGRQPRSRHCTSQIVQKYSVRSRWTRFCWWCNIQQTLEGNPGHPGATGRSYLWGKKLIFSFIFILNKSFELQWLTKALFYMFSVLFQGRYWQPGSLLHGSRYGVPLQKPPSSVEKWWRYCKRWIEKNWIRRWRI